MSTSSATTSVTTSVRFREAFLPPPFPLIDVHLHLGESDTGEIYYPPLLGDEVLELMDAAHIERTCAFAPARTDGYRAANDALAAWCAGTGGRVRAFARIGGAEQPVTEPALWLVRRKLRRAVTERRRPRPSDLGPDGLARFDGVKLLPHLDGMPSDDVFDEIARRRLPVLIHGGKYSSPRWIEKAVLPRVPGPLIVAHLGAFPAEEALLPDALDLAERYPNVWLDTSGAWVSDFIRHAVRRVPRKILFGSDAPLAHPLAAWQHVSSIVTDDAVLERIGRQNALDLFGWT